MNEQTTTQKLIELLKTQIKFRDNKIKELEAQNNIQNIIMEHCKGKYKKILILLIALLCLSFIFNIYQIILY